jgi:hypothetical protein
LLLVEQPSPFSPISMLHYEYYNPLQPDSLMGMNKQEIQCIVGLNGIEFGKSQTPALSDYADGVDTMEFLKSL